MKILSRAALFAAAALLAVGAFLGASSGARAEGAKLRPDFAPPWQGGANDDVPMSQRGLDFTEPDADNLADFHGSPQHPKLALFFGGNYYFATAELVAAFEDFIRNSRAASIGRRSRPACWRSRSRRAEPSPSAT